MSDGMEHIGLEPREALLTKLADLAEKRRERIAALEAENERLLAQRGEYRVECETCGLSKKPIGRDSYTNSHCDRECPGYRQDPQPLYYWSAGDEVDELRVEVARLRPLAEIGEAAVRLWTEASDAEFDQRLGELQDMSRAYREEQNDAD